MAIALALMAGSCATVGVASGGASATSRSTSSIGGSAESRRCPVINELENVTYDAGASPTEIGRIAADYFKQNQLQRGLDNYGGDGYAWTFGYVGSLRFAEMTNDRAMRDYLVGKFDCNLAGPDNGTSASVDTRAFGDLPLEIFLLTKKDSCKTLGMDRADAQWKSTSADGITTDARYWIDDMYMITSLQVWAYRATKESKYLDRATATMLAYIAELQKNNDSQTDGLFWHTRQSKVYWGRANGWVSAGMTELLLELPAGAIRDQIMAAYRRQLDGLVPHQITAAGADLGCWRQVVDSTDSRSYPESSCSAMFTFSLVTGLKNGWLSGDKFVRAAQNGWRCLARKTDGRGLLTKVCTGTGQADAGSLTSQQQFYYSRPTPADDRHGQGPLLWAATALVRKDCPGMR